MSKLLDMFAQVRRAKSSGGMGFAGKNRTATKPRAAALVVELANIDTESAGTAIKTGADGLLFAWNGVDTAVFETLREAIAAAKASGENVVSGLHITGGWDGLARETLEQMKEVGVNYIVLPIQAPARLLALKIKDLDFVVTIPMREGDMYPLFIRNVTAFDTITAVRLDFWLADEAGSMSIEDALRYRAVREAVRFPALLNVHGDLQEADALTIVALGVQAVILTASDMGIKTQKQVKALREVLEKTHQDEKETPIFPPKA